MGAYYGPNKSNDLIIQARVLKRQAKYSYMINYNIPPSILARQRKNKNVKKVKATKVQAYEK